MLSGPNAICFDSKNDDLVVLDIYRLRRFQLRDDRKKAILDATEEDTKNTYPQLKFNLDAEIKTDLKIDFKIGSQELTLKNTEVLESGVYYKNLLIAYLEQISLITARNVAFNTVALIIDSYEKTLEDLKSIPKNKFPLQIKEEYKETLEDENQNQSKKYFRNSGQLKNKLKELFRKFKHLYMNPKTCSGLKIPSVLLNINTIYRPFY